MYRSSQKNRRLGNVGRVGRAMYGVTVAAARVRARNQSYANQAAVAVRAAYATPSAVKKAKTLDRQVRSLIASKKRDTADVTRNIPALTTTNISLLTSSTDFATAASGTGLLDMDGDECLINSVRIKGRLTNEANLDVDPTGDFDVTVRKLVVWFKKPLLVASAAGTLPPITEVLIADSINSLFVTDAANGGRFRVLSDKKWNLGTNTFQASTAVGHARNGGRTSIFYDYVVKVNKQCKFAAPSQSGSNAGGHYDSDVSAGRLDAGLLVLYTQVQVGLTSTPVQLEATRLNYTG